MASPHPELLGVTGRRFTRGGALTALLLVQVGCAREASQTAGGGPTAGPGTARPAILLVTLDTTRADAVAPEGSVVLTPAIAALAARGLRFTQAYTTAPMTLPAHASILTGLYPAGHHLHENGRRLADGVETAATRLAANGYQTAAFVSGFPLERQFGLARGFSVYDDEFGAGKTERRADATTDRAIAWLQTLRSLPSPGSLSPDPARPFFAWVHYYDPHEPYDPPSPEKELYPGQPYLAEIAAMDRALGRLLAAFEELAGRDRLQILVVADHGEGLGEHGERLHGNLLYQSTVRVPLLIAGPGAAPGVRADPVSVRQVFPTLLAWGGIANTAATTSPPGLSLPDLLAPPRSTPIPVLAEAMQPFLQYRWQPQIAAMGPRWKAIQSGTGSGGLELYDLPADPKESRDLAAAPLGGAAGLDRDLRQALRDYPLPSATSGATPLDEEAKRQLASLGYLAGNAGSAAPVSAEAPRPRDMTALFDDLEQASRAFVEERYPAAIPLLERVLARDPRNPMVAVRLAVCHSLLGRDEPAVPLFRAASRLAPESADVRHYFALHQFQRGRLTEAETLFEQVLRDQPDRQAALESLATIRERQGRFAEASELLSRAIVVARQAGPLRERLGLVRMALGDTPGALAALEEGLQAQGPAFTHDLELGVLYLAARRPADAAAALDRVPEKHPEHALALFKRAQASVLLGEADREARIRRAFDEGTPETRRLIAQERLFSDP